MSILRNPSFRRWGVRLVFWPALTFGAVALWRGLTRSEPPMPRLPVRRSPVAPRSSRLRRLKGPAPEVVLPTGFWDASHSAALQGPERDHLGAPTRY
jgi:hypothetical protein